MERRRINLTTKLEVLQKKLSRVVIDLTATEKELKRDARELKEIRETFKRLASATGRDIRDDLTLISAHRDAIFRELRERKKGGGQLMTKKAVEEVIIPAIDKEIERLKTKCD